MESVAAFAWNGWQASSGISGNLGLEYAQATGFHRMKGSLAAKMAAKTDSYMVCFRCSWPDLKSNGGKPHNQSIKFVPACGLHRTSLSGRRLFQRYVADREGF